MKTLKYYILVLCLLSLAGCASVTPSSQTATTKAAAAVPPQDAGNRVATLSNIQNWNINALIAIRSKQKNYSATLQWQQNNQNYTILMFGPIGTGSIKLVGSPGAVTLTTADGKTFNAASPEAILSQQVGMSIPVSNLYYWVRGLAAPGIPSQPTFDTAHRLTGLQQQGWQILFLQYAPVNNIDLPSKIYLFNSDLNVKIVIKQWGI